VADDWFKKGSAAPPAPQKPKFGVLRLVIFAALALWVYSRFSRPPADAEGPNLPPADRGAKTEPALPQPQREIDRQPQRDMSNLPSRDWKVDDLDGGSEAGNEKRTEAALPAKKKPREDASDWSLEEVETKNGNADNEVRFDPRGNSRNEDTPKLHTQRDWSLEEVETKK